MDQRIIRIDGFFWGFQFNRIKLGTGFQWMYQPFTYNSGSGTLSRGLIDHFFYTEIQLYQHERWKTGIRYMIGYGWNPSYSNLFKLNLNQIGQNPFFVFYEPGASVHYSLNPWLELQSDFIYRFCYNNHKDLRNKMSQPAWILTFNLQYGYLLKRFWPQPTVKISTTSDSSIRP